MEHCKRTQKTEMCIYTNICIYIYTNIMCHLQSYSIYNNQPATWVQLITVFFKIKHKKVNPGVFPWVSKLFPNNPEVSTAQRIEKKKTNASSKRSSEVAEVTEICLGSSGEAEKGLEMLVYNRKFEKLKIQNFPQKLNLKFEAFGWRLLEDAWSFSIFWKCLKNVLMLA